MGGQDDVCVSVVLSACVILYGVLSLSYCIFVDKAENEADIYGLQLLLFEIKLVKLLKLGHRLLFNSFLVPFILNVL